jgi:hypothetical protein
MFAGLCSFANNFVLRGRKSQYYYGIIILDILIVFSRISRVHVFKGLLSVGWIFPFNIRINEIIIIWKKYSPGVICEIL